MADTLTRLGSLADQMPLIGNTPSWQGAVATFVAILVFYVSFGSFRPSTQRRRAVRNEHVLSSNLVMLFALITSALVVAAVYFVGGTDMAFCAFIGVAVYFANSLVCGGAFLGVVGWGVGLLGVLKVVDPALELSHITYLYTLFAAALVVAYPAFGHVFPGWVVNSVAALVIGTMLEWGDKDITSDQSWLVVAGLFFLLQGVAHPTYRESATSFSALCFIAILVAVAHLAVLSRPQSMVLLLAAFLATKLGCLTLYHNRRPASYVRYDPHQTRASVVSVAVFLVAAQILSSGAVGNATPAVILNGVLYMVVGHGAAVVLSAAIFGLGGRWLPEDSQGWRLVMVDMLMLLPYFALPIVIVALYTGAYRMPLDWLVAIPAVSKSGAVSYFRRLSDASLSLVLIAVVRVMSEVCTRALESHSMTFLPLLVKTADRGSARTQLLGLTFNGGPDPSTTPALLALLEESNATATFFITKARAAAFPHLVRAIADEGHDIGILGTVSVDPIGMATYAEAKAAMRLFKDITGNTPRLYRPPISGSRGPVALQSVASLGLTVTMWALCPWEWEGSEADVYDRLPSFLDASGHIVLLHEVIPTSISDALMPVANDRCVDTAGLLLKELEGHGMESVALSAMLPDTKETLP